MLSFAITSCIEHFYTYRSAQLCASIWFDLDDNGKKSLSNYLKRMGYRMDNHICWKNKDGMCFCYSDGQLGLGTEIIEEKW